MGSPDELVRRPARDMLIRRDRRGDWRAELAAEWAARLNRDSCLPMAPDAVARYLAELIDLVVDALDDPSRIDEAGRVVGSRLVDVHATSEETLPETLALLRDNLPRDCDESSRRLLWLLSSIAAGYVSAHRESTFAQQETMKRALLRSKLQADRDLEVSEARFREVFTSTPIGVAICDLGGRFVQVNPALEDTVGRRSDELMAMTIHELFHADEVDNVSAAYEGLAHGGAQRLQERRRLVRADGEEAWVYLAVSMLSGADGKPSHFVTMIEDISELHLLQERFQHQALHDPMTGLPNRQFFRSRLETTLANLAEADTLVLYHLRLDGFELINDGLGYEFGDSIIRAAARRLEQLVSGADAMVARLGGTEFAILLRESAQTPSVPELAAMINEELSEPVYVGEHGIATSASIGIVKSTVDDTDPANVLWAADVALRRAEAAGKRQWALFDPDRAPSERTEARLAAGMPGALELGQFQVVYQPLVGLADGRVTALEAQLSWQPEGIGVLGHRECLDLAERSGVTLSLRDWMLGFAWQQLAEWHEAGHLARLLIELSPNQAQDPDVVATVRDLVSAYDLDPGWLRLSLPFSAVTGEFDEVRDNVRVLDEMGVQTALHDFRASPEELHRFRSLPVRSVRLAAELVRLVEASTDCQQPEARAFSGIVPMVRERSVPLVVSGIGTERQARRWRELGCDVGIGPHFGEPIAAAQVGDYLSGAGM